MVSKILVMDHLLAGHHKPEPNTLLIRILDGIPTRHYSTIREWDKFLRVLEYRFDDVEGKNNGNYSDEYIRLDSNMAKRMVSQVKSLISNTEILAVSCYAGQSRSIATAGALNHVFKLNIPDEEYFDYGYHQPNMFVYNKIIEAGRKKGLNFKAKWMNID